MSTKKNSNDVLDKLSLKGRKRVERASRIIGEVLREELDETGSFAEHERTVLEITNEIARRELERDLQRRADGYGELLRIDHNNDWHGIREGTEFDYRKHQPGTVTYHSLVGGLRVRRYTYRETTRNGPTYVPLELDVGLIEQMTPCLAKVVALGYADMPTRRFERLLSAAGCRPPSRSTLERSATDMGRYASVANEEIEPEVRAQEVVPTEAKRIVLGLDRTAVPMRSTDGDKGLEHVDRDLRRSRPKPRSWLAIGEVQWRMDYVGTVTWVDADGRRLTSRSYRLPSDADPSMITKRMLADVRHSLLQQPFLEVAVIQDGARELWGALGDALGREPLVQQWYEILDWYHLDERLGDCLDLVFGGEDDRDRVRKRWHTWLLKKPGGVGKVIRSLKRYQGRLSHSERDLLDSHIRYIENQKPRAQYAKFKHRGLPIGSGPTEGACKSLVGARAKRSGQRWSQRGLTAALHLRSIHESDRFASFWPIFSNRYRATSIAALC